ncbi:MAG: hypothetical protein CMB16_04275 [Euryarchaeota archaeon]|nr:hypothetical protein [Euryarchaeota archaeon]|tara:strand:- start:16 stop:447 length:432 start_codon:yes stop_codon:yes gene_type:complete
MALPPEVIGRLARLEGYDLMLEMDSVSRNYNLSLGEIETLINTYKSGKPSSDDVAISPDFSPVTNKEVVDLDVAVPLKTGPNYIDNPDQYRMKYNPSEAGISNQSKVRQAIICPECSAPLGIPDVRPIKVTCPQCMHEAVFYS